MLASSLLNGSDNWIVYHQGLASATLQTVKGAAWRQVMAEWVQAIVVLHQDSRVSPAMPVFSLECELQQNTKQTRPRKPICKKHFVCKSTSCSSVKAYQLFVQENVWLAYLNIAVTLDAFFLALFVMMLSLHGCEKREIENDEATTLSYTELADDKDNARSVPHAYYVRLQQV